MVTLGPIEELGTKWWFELFDCPTSRVDEVYSRLTAELARFNRDYSRFRDDSYIGHLNHGQSVASPPAELLELLQFGLRWYDLTDGYFNFLSGHLQEAQGYDAQYSFVNRNELLPVLNPREHLICSAEKVVLTAGKLDFGGFAKGYLIDHLATLLRTEYSLRHFLINGGGDMYSASDTEPIEVYIEHPTASQTYIAAVPLCNQALAVSSSYKRTWNDQVSGERKNHFLDTTVTSRLVEGSSYVIAETAVEADTLATIATVAPPEVSFPLLGQTAVAYAVWPADTSLQCSQLFTSYLLRRNE